MRKYKNVTIMLPVEPLSNVIALNSLFFQASSREGTKTEVINAAEYIFFCYLVPESNQWKRVTRNGINWDGPTGKACFSGRNSETQDPR